MLTELFSLSICPNCKSKHLPENVRTISMLEMTFYYQCPKCQIGQLITLDVNAFGKGKVLVLLTDLSFPEVQKFNKAESISADEILELYESNAE